MTDAAIEAQETGPSKGLDTISLLSSDDRLKGRPKSVQRLRTLRQRAEPLMSKSCVFVRNQTEEIEQRLHGRTRRPGR